MKEITIPLILYISLMGLLGLDILEIILDKIYKKIIRKKIHEIVKDEINKIIEKVKK